MKKNKNFKGIEDKLDKMNPEDLKNVTNILTDIMFETTGDIKFKFIKVNNEYMRLNELIFDNLMNIENSEIEKLINIVEQFNKILKDNIKELDIKE